MRTVRRKTLLIALCLVFLLFPLPASAQCCGPMIVGRISDADGAVIPNAKVGIINLATQRSTKLITNQLGEYSAPHLPLGAYKVRVSAKGFKTAETSAQTLEIDKVLRFDVTLELKNSARKQ